MKFPAWYGIVASLLMVAQWTFSILAGSVPEFQSAPWEITFHLAAEFATAIVLIAGGMAMLRSLSWARTVLLLGPGMVMYSEIVTPGYFAQLNQWALVTMFAVLVFGAVWSSMLLLREQDRITLRMVERRRKGV